MAKKEKKPAEGEKVIGNGLSKREIRKIHMQNMNKTGSISISRTKIITNSQRKKKPNIKRQKKLLPKMNECLPSTIRCLT